ncbi:hypothetical protein [Burkholderia vietnamiensis]|uniref:hypothetical protein n=1 Tax=Burkholderia vietnamiensis TaxID=60552 RepID=UPI0012DB4B85|nr:hypothetical protein [Burkholderia vietnamiensis]
MSAPEERTDERTVTLVRMVAHGLCRSDIQSFIFDMGRWRVRFESRVASRHASGPSSMIIPVLVDLCASGGESETAAATSFTRDRADCLAHRTEHIVAPMGSKSVAQLA